MEAMSDLMKDMQAGRDRVIRERRYAIVPIDPGSLAFAFRENGRATEVVKGLPSDAFAVGANYEPHRAIFLLMVGSEEFLPQPMGKPLPEILLEVRTFVPGQEKLL